MLHYVSLRPSLQKAALENAARILKPGGAGTLAVADFFLRGRGDSSLKGLARCARQLETAFQRTWFKQVLYRTVV